MLTVPLPARDRVSGGLNLYLRGAVLGNRTTRSRTARFAGSAAVRISNMYLYVSAAQQGAQLRAALDSCPVIDQAKGILMERGKLTADQAFQVLVGLSMRSHRKVREIAEHLVETGELPQT